VDGILRSEKLRPVDPLRAVVRSQVGEELFVGIDGGDQLVGVAAGAPSAGGGDVGASFAALTPRLLGTSL
jgi:hypothetical protein